MIFLKLAVKAVEEIPIQTNNAIHLSLLKCEEVHVWYSISFSVTLNIVCMYRDLNGINLANYYTKYF